MKIFIFLLLISLFKVGELRVRKRDQIKGVAEKALGMVDKVKSTAQSAIEELMKEPAWWTTAVIYDVAVSSFKDSDGDGVGDIKGVIQKLPYLKGIGVDTIMLTPAFTYPQYGQGYSLKADRLIDPLYGNMEDMRALIEATHALGMHILIEVVPNRVRPQHPWFKKSVKKVGKYKDYFVWTPPVSYDEEGDPVPSNSWVDINDRNIWIWNDVREEFYLAQANEHSSVFKLGNPHVVQEMMNNVKFWLDNDIDGFRVDALEFLCDERHFQKYIDENPEWIVGDRTKISLDNNYNLPEKCETTKLFTDMVEGYIKADNKTRLILVKSFGGVDEQVRHYQGEEIDGNPRFMIPINIQMVESINQGSQSSEIKQLIEMWLDNLQQGDVPNWIMSHQDTSRVATKVGPDFLASMNMLLLMLPGITLINMGQEIGMQNAYIRKDLAKDTYAIFTGETDYFSQSRDFGRTPMQWDASTSAGFSTNRSTWLPVHPNYYEINVDAATKVEKSNLKVFKNMALLKQSSQTLKYGSTQVFSPDPYILVVKRFMWSYSTFILVINTDLFLRVAYVSGYGPHPAGDTVTVVLASPNSDMKVGQQLRGPLYPISMLPRSAVLLKTNVVWKKNRTSSKMNTQLDIVIS